ncbi:hypothetical protein JW698_00250 [Candidatus Wolfebacteria bacterium]|nr:hypothetical protein [Candidatus Wolfebacteria bacterium]
MRLKILHSKKREKEKLLNIYDEYQWFIDNKFPVILPGFYDKLYKETKTKKLFKIKLGKELDRVYNKELYKNKIRVVKNKWKGVEIDFFNILKKYNQKPKNEYFCYVSLYGPEGQFEYPNIIDLRIKKKLDIKQINETIAHEIIHLSILNKAKKLGLNYEQIEGVVDLFFKETALKKLFPSYKLQSIAKRNIEIFRKILV